MITTVRVLLLGLAIGGVVVLSAFAIALLQLQPLADGTQLISYLQQVSRSILLIAALAVVLSPAVVFIIARLLAAATPLIARISARRVEGRLIISEPMRERSRKLVIVQPSRLAQRQDPVAPVASD